MALIAICVLVSVCIPLLGWGWAATLSGPEVDCVPVVAGVLGLVLLSVTGAWCAVLDIRVGMGLALLVVMSAVGWLLALYRNGRPQQLRRFLVSGGLVAALTVVVALTGVGFNTDTAIRFRIGPDAIGYVASGSAVGNGANRTELVSQLERETGGTPTQVFDNREIDVDSAPSLRVQVVSEFLLGAQRWGLAFAIGALTSIVGPVAVWQSAAALIGYALALSAAMIWVIVRKRAGPAFAAAAVAAALFNASLLNAWLEGGLGQMWIMPISLLLVGLLVAEVVPPDHAVGLSAAAFAGIIASYSDGLTVMLALLGGYSILAAICCRELLRRCLQIGGGLLLALLVLGPFSATLIDYLRRRSADARAGGWWQPNWLSPAEILGVWNSYSDPQAVLWPLSTASEFVAVIGSVVVLAWLTAVLVRAGRDPAPVVVIAASAVVAAVYVSSRLVLNTSNYQLSKAAATMAPVLAISIAITCSRAWQATRTRIYGGTARALLMPIGGLLAVAVVASGVDYLREFAEDAQSLPQSTLAQAYQSHELIGRYDLISRGGLEVNALSTVADLRLISRSEAARVRARGDGRDLALVATSVTCARQCPLARRTPHHVVLGGGLFVVAMNAPSREYSAGSRESAESWVERRERALGLR